MTFGILEMLVGFAIPEWVLVRWTEDGVAIFVANNISSWFALYVRQDFEVRRRHRDSMDLTFSDMGHLSWLSPNTYNPNYGRCIARPHVRCAALLIPLALSNTAYSDYRLLTFSITISSDQCLFLLI